MPGYGVLLLRSVFTPSWDGVAAVAGSFIWRSPGVGLHLVVRLPWQTTADCAKKKDLWTKVNVKSAAMSWLAQIPRTEQD